MKEREIKDEFELINQEVEAIKKKQNAKFSKLSEEEIVANMVQSIQESVEFAKKNNIDVVEIEE